MYSIAHQHDDNSMYNMASIKFETLSCTLKNTTCTMNHNTLHVQLYIHKQELYNFINKEDQLHFATPITSANKKHPHAPFHTCNILQNNSKHTSNHVLKCSTLLKFLSTLKQYEHSHPLLIYIYPYLFKFKLHVNTFNQLVDEFHLLVQQEFIPIKIQRVGTPYFATKIQQNPHSL
jgi:hypothetical protein